MSKPPELQDTLPGPVAGTKQGARTSSRDPPEDPANDFTLDSAENSAKNSAASAPSADSANEANGLAATIGAGAQPVDATPATSGEFLPFPAWDRYKVVSFLGLGGMGAVYKARDRRLKRSVAIKFLRGSQADAFDTRQRRRFEREASAQARIEHPHICKIFDVGEVEGQPYIAMQLIHGSSLVGMQQVLSREDKVRVLQKVAEALHAAHAQNLIHRDLKPANIMVERRSDGSFWPYLMDFGLVKEVDTNTQSSTGGVEGTPAYMAPEQARGETRLLDARTDVYGLGATLYGTLAGRPPFVGNSTDVLLAVLLEEPPRLRTLDPGIPPALETIVHKCLEKEPHQRYHSAQAMADDLGRFLDGQRIAARPPGTLQRIGRFAKRHKLVVASALTALVASLVLGGIALRIRLQAAAQARLAQHLGQEITKMEWLLRSARQMPLHNLEREKAIIRNRMTELQTELAEYGEISQGLAHYALGRGHLALHEYPQALTELEKAKTLGVQGAEVHYALGIVLGKHFEQAMYEARLAGGGDWAQKQLKELEPKYLTPAIAALQRSRSIKLDAPQYLEGLIAYYQRDYAGALKHSDAALQAAPWLYEASKLAGDVHLEQALRARDSGHNENAEREFAGATRSYEQAAAIGQSDGEVYEGLAEAWVRRLEMSVKRGLSADAAYAEAVAASSKLMTAEPDSVMGPLKNAFAAMMTMGILGVGLDSLNRAQQCMTSADAALRKQPGHPYASEVAAICHVTASEAIRMRGEDPLPLQRKALSILEPIVKKHPRFLWGLNDLGGIHGLIGQQLQKCGNPEASAMLQKSVDYYVAAASVDPSYVEALSNSLRVFGLLVLDAKSVDDLHAVISHADDLFARCKAVNRQYSQCFVNYFISYAIAANRVAQLGRDPQSLLKRAGESFAEIRQLGASFLDAEQHAALTHLVVARDHLTHHQDPASALNDLQSDLTRCFALVSQDAMCRTLDAQSEWMRADWLAAQKQPFLESLQAALRKSQLATQSPESYPDAWQTLAESHLRLARAELRQPQVRDQHLVDGLSAVDKVFVINPNHALGLATQGALQLMRAQSASDEANRLSAAQSALQALRRALKIDPFLMHDFGALLDAARAFVPAAN